ncbi:hypothetical protein DFH09DRAFT_1136452 [Mycena vulgaris]|nr:hypothetical protein DFH09DRAFT_1136452 [Mycena vulgaris]
MQLFAFVIAALLSATAAYGLESETTTVSESAAANPGFTWCYEPSMGGRCVTATTSPDQCLNVSLADNDKASSATAHANSYCTLSNRYNCGTNGETLEILPLARIDRFSDYKFHDRIGSYRCKHVVKPPTKVTCNILVTDTNGTGYGYIGAAFNTKGFYGSLQAAQNTALAVSFSYSPSAPSRLNLRALNGPSAASESTFPYLGGIVWGNQNLGLHPGGYATVFLGGTRETLPFDQPRTFSGENSFTAISNNGPTFLESPIWRYNPATQALTAQWINPDGGEPETIIVLAHYTREQVPRSLVLAGDLQALLDFAQGTGSSRAVTFKCVSPGPFKGQA